MCARFYFSAIALNLESNFFDSKGYFDFSTWMLGFVHYFKNLPSSDENQIYGIRPHTDAGIFTFLATDGKPGLEVCLNGNECDPSKRKWVKIKSPPSGHLIVNLGKNLEIWSGGKFKATLHRVVLDGKEDRFSVPFFYESNLDLKIKPLIRDSAQTETEKHTMTDDNLTPADLMFVRLNKNRLTTFT